MLTYQAPLQNIPCLRRLFSAEIVLGILGVFGQIGLLYQIFYSGSSFSPFLIFRWIVNLWALLILLFTGIRGSWFLSQSLHSSKEFRLLATLNIMYAGVCCLQLLCSFVLIGLLAAESHDPLKTLLALNDKDPLLTYPFVWENFIFLLKIFLWFSVVDLVMEFAISARAAVICRQNVQHVLFQESVTDRLLIQKQDPQEPIPQSENQFYAAV